jgi:hypothetical protein
LPVPRSEVVDELWAVARQGQPPVHSGAWSRATMELCLAILASDRQQAPVLAAAPSSIGKWITMKKPPEDSQHVLQHWRESVPNDRLAHLIRDVARIQHAGAAAAPGRTDVSFGHWTFLRILWVRDGLTQKELSDLAGVMEPTTFTAVKAMEGWA